METFVIKSNTIELTYEKEYGNLVGVRAPQQNWNILDRPHLGRNWELLIPLEGRRNNPAYGYTQKMKSLTLSPDGSKAVMTWDKVQSEFGGVHDIGIEITVEVVGEGIVWNTTVVNNDTTGKVVENVFAPIFGDVRIPENADECNIFQEGYNGPNVYGVHPRFNNTKGYWGVDVPTQIMSGAPEGSPYILFRASNSLGNNIGIYLAPYENIGTLVTWRLRLFPGQLTEDTGTAPSGDFIGGKEIYRPLEAAHLPFLASGETARLAPVHMQAFTGDWKTGVEIYKKHRDTVWNWGRPETPAWAKQPHSWLQLHINSPEDELRLRFTELPNVAQECKEYGITAIQLVGWNYGGQDQGNPCHDPDPRLGTFEELKQAIAECHAMGVKIILFAKFTWADTATEWYKKELHKYVAIDPHGNPYMYGGYQYQTLTQLCDINTKRFACLCFYSDELRKLMQKEFQKLVDLGAAGMLYDESQHHGPVSFCFADNHGHRHGQWFYGKDNQLIEEFRKLAPKDFLFCGEACYDAEMQQYDLSYFRAPHRFLVPLKRYIRSKAKDTLLMIAVTGFNEREVLNNCLMHNYIVSYEPYYFKGMPSDFPLTMEYGMKMQALREEVRNYVWDGEYREKLGANVTKADGAQAEYYSVFRTDDGKSAVVIVNHDEQELSVNIQLVAGQISRWKAVGGEWKTDTQIVIPPRTAVVAIEE